MRDGDNLTFGDEYANNVVLWEAGAHRLQQKDWYRENIRHYWDYENPPVEYGQVGCRMFDAPRDDLTHYMLYETCSEGTPEKDCPAFATMDELIDWAAEHATTFAYNKATREEWARMLSDGFVHHTEGNMVFC